MKFSSYLLNINITLFFLFAVVVAVFSQQSMGSYQNKDEIGLVMSDLENEGFYNLNVKVDKNNLVTTFENRIYRFDILAVRKFIENILPFIQSKYDNLIVIVGYIL